MDDQIKVFLGGPIQHALAGLNFDARLKRLLQETMTILRTQDIHTINTHEEGYLDDLESEISSEEATRRDYESMWQCTHYICVLPKGDDDYSYRSDGCCVELGWASAMSKTIIVLGDSDAKYSQLVEGLNAICDMKILTIDSVISDPLTLIRFLKSSSKINELV